jgi:DNA mismatch repair protein MutL
MATIHLLSSATVNQIAAGEVVENPAAVVKELVENSIDAGSTRIVVEVKGGGFQQIVVSDDGKGMSRDDAVLCFERHATSKISHIDDLSALDSMGFRGEALASIASISRVEMTTAETDGMGVRVEIAAGKVESVAPASRQRGTTFVVGSLFYTVPARKKFQKSPQASMAEIHRLVIQLALAHPEVGFELVGLFKVEPAPLQMRLEDLFQDSFLKEKFKVEAEVGGYHIKGFIGTPAEHRPNRTGQHLFINRRPVVSSQVSYAVKLGYGERLSSDRFPVFVLHLKVPPQLIDVNVHPQKKEVRFQEYDVVKTLVQQAIASAFAPKKQDMAFPSRRPIFLDEPAPLIFREEEESVPMLFQQEEIVGVFAHYLLLDGATVKGYGKGLVFVDLRQAKEQVAYHEMGQAQGLLLPLPVELTAAEAAELRHKKGELAKIGFIMQESGKHSILVEAIPPFVQECDVVETIRLVLEADGEFPVVFKKAARFALRQKTRFTLHEAATLWNRFKQLNSREGMWELKDDEIGKFFKKD